MATKRPPVVAIWAAVLGFSCAASAIAPSTLRAAEPAAEPVTRATDTAPAGTDDLPYTMSVDASMTAAAAAAWFGSEQLKSHLAPLECRWCRSNALDAGVRARLRWTDRAGAAITASNVGAYGVAPLVGFGLLALAAEHEGRQRNIVIDFLVVGEAAALAGDLGQLVKFSVGRQRPYAHAGAANPDGGQGPYDANLSFFSAHTDFTFAVAAAAGTVARMRGYRWAPAVYVVGGLVGAATGYLRIAADQHYFTDVLTGAVVGSAVGVGVPYLFHRPRARTQAAREGSVSFAVVPLLIAGGSGLGCVTLW